MCGMQLLMVMAMANGQASPMVCSGQCEANVNDDDLGIIKQRGQRVITVDAITDDDDDDDDVGVGGDGGRDYDGGCERFFAHTIHSHTILAAV